VAETEHGYLARCRADRVCPNCHNSIPEGGATGSGSHADGLFCSLDCYAEYHGPSIARRRRHKAQPNG
jgi:hypothetical protein